MKTSRRYFILKSLGLAGLSTIPFSRNAIAAVPSSGDFTLNIFSKNLHWLDYAEMAATAADLGFDGVDLTVRSEGHVLPERVAEDLPKAVEAVRKVGLQVHMITTGIKSSTEPYTENILKTASSLGIPYYRMGWLEYDASKTMEENLNSFRQQLKDLAELNKKYNIHGGYQNHSGTSFGSPVWDLWMILKDMDPRWIGSQYDILHAMVEGANAWQLGLKLLKSHIRTLDIKDFVWQKSESKWKMQVVPLGEGMVDYNKYLRWLKEYNVHGPFSMHFEYPLGGAENGARLLTMRKEDVLMAIKRDVGVFRRMLAEAGF
jgi:L-ribulose-5-phosphate 3-epimerase